MKKLEKIRLNEAVNVLTDDEMKFVRGGLSNLFICERIKKDGTYGDTFSTDSAALAVAWAEVWNANSDWMADCHIYYSPYKYV